MPAAIDADVVLFVYRGDYDNLTAPTNPTLVEVIVARHPSGLVGTVWLAARSPQGRFEDAVHEEGAPRLPPQPVPA